MSRISEYMELQKDMAHESSRLSGLVKEMAALIKELYESIRINRESINALTHNQKILMERVK